MQNNQVYVIGHVNPDTDSIAAAMGYAWLLRERDGMDTVASRAGPINPQTAWVLQQLNIDPPYLLTDASPRFSSVTQRLDSLRPDAQHGAAWTLASRTGGVAPVVDEEGKPYGIINGFSLFRYFSEVLGPRPGDTTVHEMMSAPCRDAADTTVPRFAANAHIRDSLNRILRDEYDDFWIVDENDMYAGVARQRNILNPPRLRIILVDPTMTMPPAYPEIASAIRNIPDFPKPGIQFKDITPLLANARLFARSVDLLIDGFKPGMVDAVVGIDARGFIFAAAAALELRAGFVPIRKKGKLPYQTYEQDYALEYGSASVAMHTDALQPGSRVLLIVDLLATGGTAAAAAALVEKVGARILQISFLIELAFLNGREKLRGFPVRSLVVY